jgi:hypothetical protein
MERFCGIIKPMARSKSKLDMSIAKGVVLAEHLKHLPFVHSNFADPHITVPEDISYPRLANLVDLKITSHQLLRLLQVRQGRVIQSLQPYKHCHLSHHTTIGSRKSQVCSDTNRDDHRILYHSMQGEQKFGLVEFFVTVTGEESTDNWAYVATLTGVVRHTQERVVAVQQEGWHTWIQVEQMDGLIGLLKEGKSQFYMIVSDEYLF